MRKLYGAGVGPGDPELLTLKTYRVLSGANVTFCPERGTGAGSLVSDIIEGLLENTETKVVNLVYPMHYHDAWLREMWRQNAGCTIEYLNGERTDALITSGDPAIYNTFMYTLSYIEATGVKAEVVPDITSSCATTDSMKMPLVARNEDLIVAPIRENSSEDLGRVLRKHDNMVLMKPFTDPEALLRAPEENHSEGRFVLIIKTGTGEKRLVTDFEDLKRYDIPYLSTITIKKQRRQ